MRKIGKLIFLFLIFVSAISFSKDIALHIDKIYLIENENTKIKIEKPEVLKLVNDSLVPLKQGKTKVFVYNKEKLVEKLNVKVLSVKKDEFDKIRESWKDFLLGDKFFDKNDKQMLDLQKKFDRDIIKISEELKLDKDNKVSSYITKTYRDILKIAIATMNPNSKYYLDTKLMKQVKDSLDWMKENKYNKEITPEGNWWDYEIGAPRAINEIMVIFYPALKNEYIKDYVDILDRFIPFVDKIRGSIKPELAINATGANQADISKNKILQSALRKDEKTLVAAKDALRKLLIIVDKGDGFYSDGSFVQHGNIAYTGGYGNVLIDVFSQMMSLLENSKYKIDFKELDNLKFWISESFAPIMYKGLEMDMLKGRSISREATYYTSAREVLRSVLRISKALDNEEFKSLAKSWILENSLYSHIEKLENYRDMYLAKEILNNDDIKAKDFTENTLKNYKFMDRVVYKNKEKDFAFALSMSSTRIKYYEAMNKENLKGYYTGDGMFYLYNNDLKSYNDDFWPTVDPYELAGITVDKTLREDASGVTVSDSKIAGGVKLDDKYGSFAMQLSNFNKNLKANKSYFIFDDKIVFLGSNINFTSKEKVQTIIDNRKLSDNLTYEIYVDGKLIDLKENSELKLNNAKSIYLKSSDNQSIGYRLIDNKNISIKLEKRVGSWKDINNSQKEDKIEKTYLTIFKDHLNNKDKYGYIIYPNISLDDLLTRNDIFVQRFEDNIHVIKDKNQIEAINVFEKGQYIFENFKINGIITMMVKKENDNYIIVLSTPDMEELTDQVIFKKEIKKDEIKNKTRKLIFKTM